MKKFLGIVFVLCSCHEHDPVYYDFNGYQKDFIFYKKGDTINFQNKANEVFQYVVKKYDVGYSQKNLFPRRTYSYFQHAEIEFGNVANDQYVGRISTGVMNGFSYSVHMIFPAANFDVGFAEYENNKLFYDSIQIHNVVYDSVYMIYQKSADNSISQQIYLNKKFGFIQFKDSVINETYTRL